jgi:hypothetical protein
MDKEYYRLKIENGEISVAFFDKGNPIPHTKYKGKLSEEKTKHFLEEAYNRFSDDNIKKFLKSFVNLGESYKERMKKDFE